MSSLDGFSQPRRITSPHIEQNATVTTTNETPGRNISLDIEDVLHLSPDVPAQPKKRWRFPFGPGRQNRLMTPKALARRKLIKRSVLALLLILLALGGYMGWSILSNTSRVFKGNPIAAIFSSGKPLKTDQFGRSNILIFTTDEDDPAYPNGDDNLNDSIIVLSVDQKKHDAFMFNVPRDLWVKIPDCNLYSEEKINAVYKCAKDEASGQQALHDKVSSVFGIDTQYILHVNDTVLKTGVDALGGVDVTIDSSDPRGILDRNFDWRCGYKCYLVKWPNGPAHLDGTHALFLAQARNDAGGYGLPRGNFDREANQRRILIAIKEKAASLGFLANPIKVTQLLDSLGQNIRTNIDSSEIKTLIDVSKNMDSKSIISVSLVDTTPSPLTTGKGPNGSSIVRPTKGLYDYSDLAAIVHAYLSGNGAILNERATIDVFNASGITGQGQQQATTLTAQGLIVGTISNAPAGDYGKLKLYDLTKGDKPATKQKLEQLLGVTAVPGPLPAALQSNAGFVVVIGVSSGQ